MHFDVSDGKGMVLIILQRVVDMAHRHNRCETDWVSRHHITDCEINILPWSEGEVKRDRGQVSESVVSQSFLPYQPPHSHEGKEPS
jgi:hypothetical protein